MRSSTRDDYEKAVNKAVDYINAHLFDSPNVKQLSEIAGISEFHFHRIFKTIIGENIGEFTLRLRLEDIAQRLRMTNHNLATIAEQTGYGTKYALSKAFKKHFGISPSAYKIAPQNTVFFERKDERKLVELHPILKNIDSKRVAYVRIVDWYGSPESYARAWKKLGKFGIKHNLITRNTEYIGLSFDDPTITPPDSCRFYACFTCAQEIKPDGAIGIHTIGGGLYAVFTLKGAYSGLLDLYFNIYINWLPASKYSLRKMIAFEKYLNTPGQVPDDELLTEIYVPIKLKQTKKSY